MAVKLNVEMTVTLNPKAIALIKQSGPIGAIRLLEETTGEAIRNSPFKRGTNRRSINWMFNNKGTKSSGSSQDGKAAPTNIELDKTEGAVFTQSSYGGYLEVGTGLFGPKKQLIKPTSAKALSWIPKAGGRVFAASTRGMKPQPYMLPALQTIRGKLSSVLTGVVEEEAKKKGLKTT